MEKIDLEKRITWKEAVFAPIKSPWLWACAIPFAGIMTYYSIRFADQAEEIYRSYNQIPGVEKVEFDRYRIDEKEVYKKLYFLNEKGIKVDDDVVRLGRNIDNFHNKLPF